MIELAFQQPMALLYGAIAIAAVLGLFAYSQLRSGIPRTRVLILTTLRTLMLLALVGLMAKPVWTNPDDDSELRDTVIVLFDRSESMSLRESGTTRYEEAIRYARSALVPVLNDAEVRVQSVLFADEPSEASGAEIARTQVDGKSTNLARAIARSITDLNAPPLAIIALTDGVTNVDRDNSRAVSKLVTHRVPFVGLGFGTETGGQILSIDKISAPSVASPHQRFRVSARLRSTGDHMPSFELLLLRDGQLADRRSIPSYSGARMWQESFELSEEPGIHTYTVQLMPPNDPAIKTSGIEAAQTIRIVDEGDLRVLYLQGGLTWDYKFIQLALRTDPTIQLSGLSRTASTSKFFENVQNDIDLVDGFPSTLDKLSDFRVVVLSNLRPGDLTPLQQELLARFCGELGGGVLMIGGPETFNSNWRDSRLEELLPVEFTAFANQPTGERFSVRLTEQARRHPVFQITDESSTAAAWSALPMFSDQALVANVKPGAEVWLEHTLPAGGRRPVLMASQRFGNGFSTVICMQNFWRWRLAKLSNTDHFDRFWQQLLRHLSEAGRETISLALRDQQLQPGKPVNLIVERRADPQADAGATDEFHIALTDADQTVLERQSVRLAPTQSVPVSFQIDQPGTYTAAVENMTGTVLASRSIDIRDTEIELAKTAIQMQTLKQWAGLSGGFAEKAEDCADLKERLRPLLDLDQLETQTVQYAVPAGINGWSLAILMSLLAAEWILRKRWQLR